MSTIEKSIEVNVPVRTAYNQWTQFEEFPRFMEGVKEVTQLDDTRLHWKAATRAVPSARHIEAQLTRNRKGSSVAAHFEQLLDDSAANAPTGFGSGE